MISDGFSDDDLERLQVLQALEGYADLGLLDLAWAELKRLRQAHPDGLEVIEAELLLLMREQRWTEAFVTGRRLCNEAPDRPWGFIHTAYCLHEAGATAEALRTLRSGPEALQEEALFHYNLGCYLAVLGDTEAALEALVAAFALYESLERTARTDPDLAALRLDEESADE